jgi:hypothetical protein
MDTSKLKVGQKVRAQSGDDFKEGTVLEITEKCVEVELDLSGWRVFIRFDRTGKQPEGNDPEFGVFAYDADSWSVPRPVCGVGSGTRPPVFSCGEPWELVEHEKQNPLVREGLARPSAPASF